MGVERVLRRLRWVALGYQYDWSSLSYDWKQQPQPLHPCITHFADDTVALLRQPPVGMQCSTYRPQAAVVNFYQIGDSLTSHVDRSEPAAAAPLVPLMLLLFPETKGSFVSWRLNYVFRRCR
jgi:alkylated DNA repair protein alkB family protein 1